MRLSYRPTTSDHRRRGRKILRELKRIQGNSKYPFPRRRLRCIDSATLLGIVRALYLTNLYNPNKES